MFFFLKKGTLVWTGLTAQHRLNEAQVRARLAELKDDEERKFFLNHVYCYGEEITKTQKKQRGSTIWQILSRRREVDLGDGNAVVPFCLSCRHFMIVQTTNCEDSFLFVIYFLCFLSSHSLSFVF